MVLVKKYFIIIIEKKTLIINVIITQPIINYI